MVLLTRGSDGNMKSADVSLKPIRQFSSGECLLNVRGQSLIQAMITMAITAIIMSAMISMQVTQTQNNKALAERLAALDFSRSITSNLSNLAACNSFLDPANVVGGVGALTFDATNVSSANPHLIKLNSIFGVLNGGSVTPSTPSLLLNLTNATPAGIQLNVSSTINGTLLVNFNQSSLVRRFHDLVFSINLISTGPLNATKIVGCDLGGSPSANYYLWEIGTPSCYISGGSYLVCVKLKDFLPSFGPINTVWNPVSATSSAGCYGPTNTWVDLGPGPAPVMYHLWKCQ